MRQWLREWLNEYTWVLLLIAYIVFVIVGAFLFVLNDTPKTAPMETCDGEWREERTGAYVCTSHSDGVCRRYEPEIKQTCVMTRRECP